MPTVVIIHAGDDTLPARALAEKLRAANLTPVLEQTSSEALRAAVKAAPVTLVLWSPRSIDSPTISDEVSFARGKSKVLHVTMQNSTVPEAFRSDRSVNLTGWRGEDDFAAWCELAGLVTERAGVKPLPPAAPKPPSGFFQPGVVREAAGAGAPAPAARAAQTQRAPQPQRAEPQRAAPPRPQPAPRAPAYTPERETSSGSGGGGGGRGMMIGIIAFLVVAVAGGGGYYFWNQSQNQATTTAWDAVAQNDPDALRAFLAGDPGDFRDEAQQALRQLEERSFDAAQDSDTIDGFENFLNDFPDSEHAIAARGRIAELQTMTPTDETTVDPALAPPTGEAPANNDDLAPPGAVGAAPADPGAGPAPIAPPPAEPTPDPAAPTN